MESRRLILASASPRRQALLAQLGLDAEIRPADIPERPLPEETPEQYVRRIAAEKSRAIQTLDDSRLPVLAADTEVVLDGEIFGKPADLAQALEMLARLSGREHAVLSAVSLRAGERHLEALSLSRVRFRPLTVDEIRAYWATGESRDKAGGYAIQGLGALFVEHLSGSYSGVMGLPLRETGELLRQIGLDPLPPQRKGNPS
ncbi:Maf family protein [Methyloparacoccus murrellii]